jgi:hypothetical protein
MQTMPALPVPYSSLSNRGVPMAKFSKYQQNIIRNYYDNRDNISLQRAQELVTELYLSEGKARERHWKNLIGHLEKLGVAPTTITYLREQDNPELVANTINRIDKKMDSA